MSRVDSGAPAIDGAVACIAQQSGEDVRLFVPALVAGHQQQFRCGQRQVERAADRRDDAANGTQQGERERIEQARQKASKIAELLKDKYQAEKVYLYGSLVWGKFHERSDIDILVVNLKGDYWKAWVEVEAIADPFPFDLVCYEDAFPSLREKILEKGLEL